MKKAQRAKIVIVGPVYPYRGGQAMFVGHLYEALAPHFDVEVINYTLLYPRLLFPGTTQYDESKEFVNFVPSRRMVNSINPISWIRTARAIRKAGADLVLFDWWNPFFGICLFVISQLIRSRYKGKILFITENIISHEARLVDRLLTKIGLHNAWGFVTLSEALAKELNTMLPGRNTYPTAVPIYTFYSRYKSFNTADEKAALGYAPDEKVLLFFGYVRKYKGLDVLLQALPGILASVPEARLLIVGEFYDNPKMYTDIVEQSGLNDKVTIINKFVSNEEVGRYFCVADLVVLPYKSGTQSGILSIAYAFDRPVLITNVGGLSEVVQHERTGLIIPPGSAEAVSKGVQRFFKLRENVDFAANIRSFAGEEQFIRVVDLFKRILRDSGFVSGKDSNEPTS